MSPNLWHFQFKRQPTNKQTNERIEREKNAIRTAICFNLKSRPQTIKSENIYSMRIRRYIFIFIFVKTLQSSRHLYREFRQMQNTH